MKLTISEGNMKIGRIPNVSLPPIVSCRSDAPCTNDCYALKALHRKTVHAAWWGNWDLLQADPERYFSEIDLYLWRRRVDKRFKPVRFFRWHVSGDIPNIDYLEEMKRIARIYSETRFLCFTKRYDLNYNGLPSNLSIIFSAWPGLPMPTRRFPIAWMQDGTETRIPSSALECPGNCQNCNMCFNLAEIGRDVVFHKH